MREPKVISTRRIVTLMVVTAGIYTLVWYQRANRELRDLGARHQDPLRDTRPRIALLAVTFGGLTSADGWMFGHGKSSMSVVVR